jgi:hypothetical protein
MFTPKEHLSSLIYPLVHQEEKDNLSHSPADDKEDHDKDIEDCTKWQRGGGCKLSRALTTEKSFAFNADCEFLINYKLKAV